MIKEKQFLSDRQVCIIKRTDFTFTLMIHTTSKQGFPYVVISTHMASIQHICTKDGRCIEESVAYINTLRIPFQCQGLLEVVCFPFPFFSFFF